MLTHIGYFLETQTLNPKPLLKIKNPCNTLFLNTPLIWRMYKGIRNKGEFNDVKLVKNSSSQQWITRNRSVVAMGVCPERMCHFMICMKIVHRAIKAC